MPRPEKIQKVEELAELLESSQGIYLTDYSGLTVEEITELRRAFHNADVSYLVIKNTLARRSCEKAGLTGFNSYLTGPNAIAVAKGDPAAPARVIADFLKEHEEKGKPAIKGAVLEGQLLSAEETTKIKDIPPREVLLSQVVSAVSSPLTGFVGGLQGILRQLVGTIDAVKRSKEENDL
ncbi:MAG: 50S ribosomal protein L10 [candidate division KSB1 bacterium]|nr:50S ribosomal protein L10 [candidate division KSB1 bacterium]